MARTRCETFADCLSQVQEAACIMDPLQPCCPIVGASIGLKDLTGFETYEFIGKSHEWLVHGTPHVAISQSSLQNLRDFCDVCSQGGVAQISEPFVVQPNRRSDGSCFSAFLMMGLCHFQGSPYLACVTLVAGEGICTRLSSAATFDLQERARAVLKIIRIHLASSCPLSEPLVVAEVERPAFAFFGERLQDHTILMDGGYKATRREAAQVPRGCLVFGHKAVPFLPGGLCFALRMDEVIPSFTGLPLVGFTKSKPTDSPGLYAALPQHLRESVLVGGLGDAFARDKPEHFKVGFKSPPQSEVQSWSLEPGVPPHKRKIPARLAVGDIIECVYSWEGRLQFRLNGEIVIDFDLGRPIDGEAEYFAVVDLSFSACSATLVPPQQRWEPPSIVATIARSSHLESINKDQDLCRRGDSDISTEIPFSRSSSTASSSFPTETPEDRISATPLEATPVVKLQPLRRVLFGPVAAALGVGALVLVLALRSAHGRK